jgi:Protein of unknown function (DUF3592)
MGGWFLDIFVEYIVRVFLQTANLIRSRRWPVVKAIVLSADCPRASFGCTVATVYYEYVINGEKYGDAFGKPFISHDSGQGYAARFAKGMDFKVRVKPNDPAKSIPLWGPPPVGLPFR